MARARPDWVICRCPYCYEALSCFEYMKRKRRKLCICRNVKR